MLRIRKGKDDGDVPAEADVAIDPKAVDDASIISEQT
jgi:hypothetical protein